MVQIKYKGQRDAENSSESSRVGKSSMEYSGRQYVGEVLHCWKGEVVSCPRNWVRLWPSSRLASVDLMERKVVYAGPWKREKGGQGTHAGEMEWAEIHSQIYTQCSLAGKEYWMVTLLNIKTVSSQVLWLLISAPEVRNVLHMEKAPVFHSLSLPMLCSFYALKSFPLGTWHSHCLVHDSYGNLQLHHSVMGVLDWRCEG